MKRVGSEAGCIKELVEETSSPEWVSKYFHSYRLDVVPLPKTRGEGKRHRPKTIMKQLWIFSALNIFTTGEMELYSLFVVRLLKVVLNGTFGISPKKWAHNKSGSGMNSLEW